MILEIENLGYKYPKAKDFTIRHITFGLEKGQILSVLGPNGAGKTTLLNCLGNLLNTDEGEIKVEGEYINKMPRREVAKRIGYVPQFHNAVYGYSVKEFVTMGRTPYLDVLGTPKKRDVKIAEEAIKKMRIEHLADKKYTYLSGGEKQQAMIARVLVQDPKIILLDEPTNHLDYGNQMRAIHMIKELSNQGYTIIMTTHNPNHALLLGGKAAIVFNGEFAFGESKEILTENHLSQIYDIDVQMMYVPEKDIHICISSL